MWIEVRDRSESRSESVVELRVVDILVVDVKLDMDKLTTIGLSVTRPGCHTRHDIGFGLRG